MTNLVGKMVHLHEISYNPFAGLMLAMGIETDSGEVYTEGTYEVFRKIDEDFEFTMRHDGDVEMLKADTEAVLNEILPDLEDGEELYTVLIPQDSEVGELINPDAFKDGVFEFLARNTFMKEAQLQ